MSVEWSFSGETWQLDAACRGAESHLFYAPSHFERKEDKELREARAKTICLACPVIDPCRDYAINIREPHGIWGGLTELERQALI